MHDKGNAMADKAPIHVRLDDKDWELLESVVTIATARMAGMKTASRSDALRWAFVRGAEVIVREAETPVGLPVPHLPLLQQVTPDEAVTLPVAALQASVDLVSAGADTPAVPLPPVAQNPVAVTVNRGPDVALPAEKPEPTHVRERVLRYMQQHAERSFTLDELADMVGFNAEKQRALLRNLQGDKKITREESGRYRAVVGEDQCSR